MVKCGLHLCFHEKVRSNLLNYQRRCLFSVWFTLQRIMYIEHVCTKSNKLPLHFHSLQQSKVYEHTQAVTETMKKIKQLKRALNETGVNLD